MPALHPLAVACEDFSHCYNQIAHCPASLACQCLGMTPEIMSTIFFSIQFMKFYLCTAYGNLATFYGGGLSQHPFQGVCQGNGAALAIWLAQPLSGTIHQSRSPNQIASAVLLTSIAMVCFIYFNNCNLFVLPPLTSIFRVFYKLSNTIWISGKMGWLSLDKCSWSGLFYYFKARQ